MRKVMVIAAREYNAAVRTKSFIISLLVLPIMMGGSVLIQYVLKDQVDIKEKRFAVIDRSPGQQLFPVLEQAVAERNEKQITDPKTGKQTKPRFTVEKIDPSTQVAEQRFDLSERVRKQELFAFLEIGPEVLDFGKSKPALPAVDPEDDEAWAGLGVPDRVAIRYQSNSPTYNDFSRWAERVLNEAVMQGRCATAGFPREKVKAVLQPVPLLTKSLSKKNAQTGQIEEGKDENIAASLLVPGGMMALMFMMIMVGATPLMQGIVEEKMQRIAEVLLGSVRPFDLMMGKLLGMVGVSITLSTIYLAAAYWAARRYDMTQFISAELLVWFVLYQMLAVLMFGSLFIAIGAACTDMRETQSMMWPVMLLITVPMFVWLNIVKEPNSTFATAISFFPFSTPMLMIIRQSVPPGIEIWQPILGVVLVLATTVVCVYAAGRIFRMGILLQGKGAHPMELVKWVFRG